MKPIHISVTEKHINTMYQLAKGLEYIHSLGISHYDIKQENIGIDQKGNIKFYDFGESRNLLARSGAYRLLNSDNDILALGKLYVNMLANSNVFRVGVHYSQKDDRYSKEEKIIEVYKSVLNKISFSGEKANIVRNIIEKIACVPPEISLIEIIGSLKSEKINTESLFISSVCNRNKDFSLEILGAWFNSECGIVLMNNTGVSKLPIDITKDIYIEIVKTMYSLANRDVTLFLELDDILLSKDSIVITNWSRIGNYSKGRFCSCMSYLTRNIDRIADEELRDIIFKNRFGLEYSWLSDLSSILDKFL